ncbi:MAG: hypothetical protein ACI90V_003723, partial [Bacillariaceae sp.]
KYLAVNNAQQILHMPHFPDPTTRVCVGPMMMMFSFFLQSYHLPSHMVANNSWY